MRIKNLILKKLLFFGAAFALQASVPLTHAGENPLLDLGFSEEHVLDLLNVCFSKSLDCKVLTRDSNGKTQVVVLIGEAHTQSEGSFRTASKLLRHYSQVGVEGRPVWSIINIGVLSNQITITPRESKRLEKLDPEVAKKEVNAFGASNAFSTLNYESSLAPDDPKKVINLEAGYEFLHIPGTRGYSRSLDGAKYLIGACATGVFGAVAECLYGVSLPYGKAAIALGIIGLAQLYSGIRELEQGVNDNLVPRDRVMAEKIHSVLSDSSSPSTIAAAMGAAHVYGVGKALKENGFVDRAQDVIKQYYASKTKFPKELSETQFRDIANPLTSAHAAVNPKSNYPKDFEGCTVPVQAVAQASEVKSYSAAFSDSDAQPSDTTTSSKSAK